MVVLALGVTPLAALDPAGIVRRKLELGSFAALVGDARLPSAIADLTRGMLAEDPEHRPMPRLLLDPDAVRARRIAARPRKRAQSPARIGAWNVWDTRALAHAVADSPEPGVAALRSGAVDAWLRRDLGETALAARVDEAVRAPARPASWSTAPMRCSSCVPWRRSTRSCRCAGEGSRYGPTGSARLSPPPTTRKAGQARH